MICLIRPPAVEWFRFTSTSITLPLGLAYIAGALETSGRKVHVIDAVGEGPDVVTRYYKGHLIGIPLRDIVARIPADAEWVGITAIFTHEWPAVVRLIDLIKETRPELTVVLGGEHITSMPEFCLMTSKADVLVLGEGEESVVDLADALETGRDLGEIDGLVFRRGQNVVVNKRRHRTKDVDSIPWPAWQHFNIKTYHDHRYMGGMYSNALTVPLLATRGCPYQCTYCSAPNMWLPQWIPRDPVKVVDEIQFYVDKYGARNFPFQDLTAITQKNWIVDFCKEILKRGLKITWQLPSGTRSEAVDTEVAKLLRQSGMVNMAYAPESASEVTRQLIKKKMKTDKLMASIEAAVAAGLNVNLFFVIGFPHDKKEHIVESLPTVERFAEAGVHDIGLNFFMMLPGTELFHSLYDDGKVQLDRGFFLQILHSNSLLPARSYSEHLSVLDLFLMKLRIYLRFYRAKKKSAEHVGLFSSLKTALKGLFSKDEHESRMESAFRNMILLTRGTLRVMFGRPWLSRKEEDRMFASWDAIYREIRRRKLAEGIIPKAPADTTQLHQGNVILTLKKDHSTPRSFPMPTKKEVRELAAATA